MHWGLVTVCKLFFQNIASVSEQNPKHTRNSGIIYNSSENRAETFIVPVEIFPTLIPPLLSCLLCNQIWVEKNE